MTVKSKRFEESGVFFCTFTCYKWLNLFEIMKEALKGKRHEVFEDSFDVKFCYNENVVRQKLDYLHLNPVRGKWQLTTDWKNYEHSSAGFYFETKSYNFEMTHFKNAGVNDWFSASNPAESLTGDSAGK